MAKATLKKRIRGGQCKVTRFAEFISVVEQCGQGKGLINSSAE